MISHTAVTLFRHMHQACFFLIPALFGISSLCYAGQRWVGTWSTSEQLVEPGNNPPSPGLTNNTIRQVVHVSIGGDSLRVRFSNEFSTHPVTLNEVHIALSAGRDTIDGPTDRVLRFGGAISTTMQANGAVMSDPLQFSLAPLSDVAITICFGSTSTDVTGHPGSRTTSYLLAGNHVGSIDFAGSVQTDHWYVINTIDVLASDTAAAMVVLGNSITDGRGSGTNRQNRWPDELSRRLQATPGTQHVAVLNQGIGGNCVLNMCLGPSAVSRFGRDVTQQRGVRWLIILEGINDIGGSSGPPVATNLINAYTQMIGIAHASGIFVYGATLLPMGGSSYYTPARETERQTVNQWIRNSGAFDAVIDFDSAMRDPDNPMNLLPGGDTGDHLHPNETGHHMMAEAVDLHLFMGSDSLVFRDSSETVYVEPECATVGADWDIIADTQASNGRYVTVRPGTQSLDQPPADSTGAVYIPFSVDSAGSFSVFARVNCPTANDDSYWVRMDNGSFVMFNGLVTTGWEWKSLNSYVLSAGEHTLTIAYREDGAKLDKVCITNSSLPPVGMGGQAENLCLPTGAVHFNDVPGRYSLEQNYPNPCNPETTISFTLPERTFVSLRVFDVLGREVANLVDGMQDAGFRSAIFDGSSLASGVYFYRMTAGRFTHTRRLVVMK